jgi:hypothetical protein
MESYENCPVCQDRFEYCENLYVANDDGSHLSGKKVAAARSNAAGASGHTTKAKARNENSGSHKLHKLCGRGISLRLPIHGSLCGHLVCLQCLQRLQVVASEKGPVRKFLDCCMCRAPKSFNAQDPVVSHLMMAHLKASYGHAAATNTPINDAISLADRLCWTRLNIVQQPNIGNEGDADSPQTIAVWWPARGYSDPKALISQEPCSNYKKRTITDKDVDSQTSNNFSSTYFLLQGGPSRGTGEYYSIQSSLDDNGAIITKEFCSNLRECLVSTVSSHDTNNNKTCEWLPGWKQAVQEAVTCLLDDEHGVCPTNRDQMQQKKDRTLQLPDQRKTCEVSSRGTFRPSFDQRRGAALGLKKQSPPTPELLATRTTLMAYARVQTRHRAKTVSGNPYLLHLGPLFQ